MGTRWRNAASIILAARAVKSVLKPEKTAFVINDQLDIFPKPSSYSAVVRQRNKNTIGATKSDLRVFMVKRSDEARFMPGMYVFPGGVIEEVDFSIFWAKSYRQLLDIDNDNVWIEKLECVENGPMPKPPIHSSYRVKGHKAMWMPSEWAFRVCALRELYEECGIRVLADKKTKRTTIVTVEVDGSTDIEGLKCVPPPAVRDNPKLFLDMFKENEQYSLAFWSLLEWSNWLTPAFSKKGKRFDTIFYLLCIDQPIEFNICQKELQGGEWVQPTNVLHDCFYGKTKMAPPQIYEMGRLANFPSLIALEQFSSERAAKAGLIQITPQIISTSDDVTISVLPGDSLYLDSEDDVFFRKLTQTANELHGNATKLHRAEFRPTEQPGWQINNFYPWGHWKILIDGIDDPSCHISPIDNPIINSRL